MKQFEMSHDLFLSPLHFTGSCDLPRPEALKIYDSTLRDGEQMPGIAMTPEQKYLIAEELSLLGCHIIDVGFPAVSAGERKSLQLILDGKYRGRIREDLEILVMCRAVERDIDTTIAAIEQTGFSAGDVTFLLFTSASPLHVKYKLGPSLLRHAGLSAESLEEMPYSFYHECNKTMVGDAIRYARRRGVRKVECGGEDASRTPLDLLIDLAKAAVEAGAARWVFADTTGSLTPEATRVYCEALTEHLPESERASHFHNDFGLATANVITGVLHGFPIFSTTVNGIGERAGNAPLHSVVASLKYLYGLEIPGFRYDRLCHVKKVVEEISGIPVAAQEPVIGYNAFSHESGIHTHGVSVSRKLYEPIPYEEVGGTPRFIYGKHSGLNTIFNLLLSHSDDIGVEVSRDLAMEVLQEVKERREREAEHSHAAAAIRDFYDNLGRLGFSEGDVIELAKRCANRAVLAVW
jgi:isopropylmalate/homocitrate/citramalate synthase